MDRQAITEAEWKEKLLSLAPFTLEEARALTPHGPFNYNVYFYTDQQRVELILKMRQSKRSPIDSYYPRHANG